MTDLAAVRVIALDTNAFAGGRLAFDQLENLVARAESHAGVEIWVPEVVVWEWAEHSYRDHVDAVARLSALRVAGVSVPDLQPRTVDDLLKGMLDQFASLGDFLVVVPSAGSVEAIKDQYCSARRLAKWHGVTASGSRSARPTAC